jgi:molybdopterin synthase catalytic subunit
MQEARVLPKIPATGVYAKDSLSYGEIMSEIFKASEDSTGAIATYLGMTKSPGFAHRKVKELLIETDPEASARGLVRLCDDVRQRFNLQLAVIYHYEGRFRPGEMLVMIAVAARARPETFEALQEIVNRFKTEGHIRKKEVYEDGESEWIEGEAACSAHG